MQSDTPTWYDQHGRYPKATSVEDFVHNLAAVEERIASACRRAGRDVSSVRLLPVSKTIDAATIRLSYAAACRMLGENKAQEAWRKWDALADVLREQPAYSALRVRGLMTLALLSGEVDRVRQCFVRLRQLREQLCQDGPAGINLDELSMGMSGDFQIVIEEGATVVRVGQAIYGARAVSDSFYWPTAS